VTQLAPPFRAALGISARGDGVFAAELGARWTVGPKAHGGLLLVLLVRAGLAQLEAVAPGLAPDPLAVAAVSRPELITWSAAHVRVETGSEVTRGVTIADLLWSDDPPEQNCEIATAVDVDGFIQHFLDRMANLSELVR